MIIGGWVPYMNLNQLYLLDIKTNTVSKFNDDSFSTYHRDAIIKEKEDLKQAILSAVEAKKQAK